MICLRIHTFRIFIHPEIVSLRFPLISHGIQQMLQAFLHAPCPSAVHQGPGYPVQQSLLFQISCYSRVSTPGFLRHGVQKRAAPCQQCPHFLQLSIRKGLLIGSGHPNQTGNLSPLLLIQPCPGHQLPKMDVNSPKTDIGKAPFPQEMVLGPSPCIPGAV